MDILELFKEVAARVSGRKFDTLTPDMPLAQTGLDSVMVMEVVALMEQRLGVRLPDEELSHVTNLRELEALIVKTKG
jgi:acyl carrier protein